MKKPKQLTDKERERIIGTKTKQINSNEIVRKHGVPNVQK